MAVSIYLIQEFSAQSSNLLHRRRRVNCPFETEVRIMRHD